MRQRSSAETPSEGVSYTSGRRGSKVLLFLFVSLLVVSCTETQAGETTSTTDTTSTTSTTLGSTTTSTTLQQSSANYISAPCEFEVPEGREVECGWLEVPEDRADSSKGTIRLHVAVFSSESSDPAPDPIVYLEGGPGGEILEAVPLIFEDRFAHLLSERDLILFDQRGTGYSQPSLACPELRELGLELIEQDLPAEEARARELEAIEECRSRLVEAGADLDSYTSLASAADLDDLRRALGFEEWNLYGISYGTRLALTAMRSHPEGIRSVVLDSVLPPEVDLYAESAQNLDRALNELFDGCAADDTCSNAYPQLEADFYELVEKLDSEPVVAPVSDIFTGETYDAVIDGAGFGGVVFQSLYSEEAIPMLPILIEHVGSGETYELSVLLSSFLANGEFVSAGMQFSVQCTEEVPFTSPQAVEAAFDEYPALDVVFEGVSNLGPAIFDICDVWEAGDVPASENEAVTSPIPTLVLAGEYDPITPPRWSESAADNLETSTFVLFPGVGHGPSGSVDCPMEILTGFLGEPTAAPDTGCVADMGAPDFVVEEAPVSDVTLVEFSQQVFGTTITGVVPEGWEQQGPGVWVRGLTGFDQTALVQQGAPGVTKDLLIGSIGSQFGIEPGGAPDDAYETWDLYDSAIGGVPAIVAASDTEGGALLVILVVSPFEKETLTESVLLPVLDAIEIG